MFEGKTELHSKVTLLAYFTRVEVSICNIHFILILLGYWIYYDRKYTQVELTDSDKPSSLLRYWIIYDRKKFCSAGPCSIKFLNMAKNAKFSTVLFSKGRGGGVRDKKLKKLNK
jgi:hypothetical protein